MTEKKAPHYFLYCRKSTEQEDRQLLSLDSQEQELRNIAQYHALKIARVFKEAKSAKAPDKRPLFAEMMARIKCGEAQGILCWKLDRLARNPDEAGKIIGMLQREEIKHIKTSEKDYFPEDNSLLSYVEFGIANQYIRDLSNNVKRGLRAKLQMGWYPSYVPLGYLNTKMTERGRNEVVKDHERFDMVKRMWQLMLTGNYTPPRILKIANEEWGFRTRQGNPLGKSNIYKIFTNPFYYGSFNYPQGSENWYKGKHEPMITEGEFDHVQAILGRKGKPRPKRHMFAFTGLMKCGACGAMITAEEKVKRQKNGNVHRYIYYHCTKRKDENCPEKSVEIKNLSAQIDKILGGLTISKKFQQWAIKYLHEIRKDEAQTQENVLMNKQRELEKVIKQLDTLLLKYISPENAQGGIISEQEYLTLKNSLLKQKTALEDVLKAQGKDKESWVELSERTFNFARYARAWFTQGDLETKRAIFACLGSNFIIQEQKLAIELRPVFNSIFERIPNAEKELLRVRTSQNGFNRGQIAQALAKCPSMLGD